MSPENKLHLQNIVLFILIGLIFGIVYTLLFYPHTWVEFLEAASISVFIGIILGSLEEFVFDRFFSKIAFYQVLIIRTLLYALLVSIILSMVLSIEIAITNNTSYGGALIVYLQSEFFQRDLFFSLIFVFLIIFIVQVIQLLGRGNFLRLMLGVYHRPREVQRIFMFIDLKGSTTIAEKLDNHDYSNFIKDFFYDVSDAIMMFSGEIYQYVGDEVVVVWRIRKSNLNFILCYYKMLEIIKRKELYYESRYGFQPEFKAGVHAGKVVMTEVGKIKKEIAYHGDTINVASRIQGKCNELKQNLLLSKDVIPYLSDHDEFFILEKGEIALKGRSEKLPLYGI